MQNFALKSPLLATPVLPATLPNPLLSLIDLFFVVGK